MKERNIEAGVVDDCCNAANIILLRMQVGHIERFTAVELKALTRLHRL